MIVTVARHECLGQLRSALTWVVAALLAGLVGYLFLQRIEDWIGVQAQFALTDNPPGLTGFLAARFLAPLAFLLSVVAPLFAMRAVSDELRSGTATLWQSSPVSDTRFALGKFFGALVVPLAITVLATTMVAAMAIFVTPDLGAVAAGFFGLALACAAFTAIGLFFSSLTRQPMVAVLGALAFILVLWLIGSGDAAGAALPERVMAAFGALAVGERLGSFFQGYLRTGDIAYLLLLTVTFIVLTILRLDALRRGTGRFHVLSSALVVAVALTLGWVATHYDHAVDVTANARHSLSSSSVAAVEALDEPVQLTAVLEPDRGQREALEALIDRFRDYKSDIELMFVNPATDPAGARALDAAPGGELILTAGPREQRLQSLSERTLAGAFRRLGRDEERDILFITGHDERRPGGLEPDDWGELSTRLANGGLVARETSLVAEPRIDPSTDVVVIAAPRRPYFPGEVASLVEHFRAGGNLLWLSEVPTADATGPGLSALAIELGVETLPGTVIDTASQSALAGTGDDGNVSTGFIVLDRFPPHVVSGALASPLLLPEARALGAVPLAGQTLEPLLQTPDSSWTETGPLEGAVRFDPDSREVAGPLLLGLTIERELDDRRQRIAVLGDADFGATRFLGNGGNAAFAESLLLWLAGDDKALEFVVRAAPDAELVLERRDIIALGVTWLMTLPFLLLGVAVVVRLARSRERRIGDPT